jgi:hypothetical protein
VERSLLKNRSGRRKDGETITLKSGTRLTLPEHSLALLRAGEGLEAIPRIIDPMLLAEGGAKTKESNLKRSGSCG